MEIRVLGPLELWTEAGVIDLGGASQRRLLAILLVDSGLVVSVSDIVDRLWPAGEQPSNADAALRTYVSLIRRALADGGANTELVLTEPTGYRLDPAGWSTDAERLSRGLVDVRSYREAGDLVRAIQA